MPFFEQDVDLHEAMNPEVGNALGEPQGEPYVVQNPRVDENLRGSPDVENIIPVQHKHLSWNKLYNYRSSKEKKYMHFLSVFLSDGGQGVHIIFKLSSGILLLLGVGEPPLEALHQIMIGNSPSVSEHQLPHGLQAELGRGVRHPCVLWLVCSQCSQETANVGCNNTHCSVFPLF